MIERSILEQALERTGGNKKAAADMLGLKRTTLSAKVHSLAPEMRVSSRQVVLGDGAFEIFVGEMSIERAGLLRASALAIKGLAGGDRV